MKYALVLLLALFSGLSFAQDKVKWSVTYNETEKQIEFRARISDGWHLYSQFIQNDIGPVPTAFVFEEKEKVVLTANVTEPQPIHAYDENFEASLDFFKDEALFIQKVAPGSKGTVSGYITYMVCNEIMCLPPVDYDFSVNIP